MDTLQKFQATKILLHLVSFEEKHFLKN